MNKAIVLVLSSLIVSCPSSVLCTRAQLTATIVLLTIQQQESNQEKKVTTLIPIKPKKTYPIIPKNSYFKSRKFRTNNR